MSNEAIGLIERAATLLRRPGLPQDEAFPGPRAAAWQSGFESYPQPEPRPIIENEDVDPTSLFRRLWRRKFTLAGSTLLLLAVAAAAIYSLTPSYVAEALVVVGNGGPSIAADETKSEATAAQMLADPATVQTEVDILRSRGLATQVTEDLNLSRQAEFNPSITKGGSFQTVEAWVAAQYDRVRALAGWGASKSIQPDKKTMGAPTAENRAAEESTATDIFSSKLTVTAKTNSRVISIQFEDPDPELAAAAVNSLVDHYMANQSKATELAAQDRTRWLDQTVAELRQRAAQSEQAYEAFRAQFEANGGRALIDRKMADTTAQLALADLARRDAETRLDALQGLRTRSIGDSATSDVDSSPVMQNLRQRAAELGAQVAQLSATLGENNPKLQTVKAGLARVNGEMRAEVTRLTTALQSEAQVAEVKEASLKQSLAADREAIAGSSDGEARLNALKADAASNRAVLEAALIRLQKAKGSTTDPGLRPDAEIRRERPSHSHRRNRAPTCCWRLQRWRRPWPVLELRSRATRLIGPFVAARRSRARPASPRLPSSRSPKTQRTARGSTRLAGTRSTESRSGRSTEP